MGNIFYGEKSDINNNNNTSKFSETNIKNESEINTKNESEINKISETNISKSKIGYEFEKAVHNYLIKKCANKFKLKSERQIRRKYNITKIDHAIIHDKIICIQSKWSDIPLSGPACREIVEDSLRYGKALNKEVEIIILLSKKKCSGRVDSYITGGNFLNLYGSFCENSQKGLQEQGLQEYDLQKKLYKKLKPIINNIGKNILYEHQARAISKFELPARQIIKYPVGTGKTITLMGCADKAIKTSNTRIIWVVKKIDILKSQFIPNREEEAFKFYPWLYSISHICYSNYDEEYIKAHPEIRIIITNIDQIMNKNLDIYDLMILDECHIAGSNKFGEKLLNSKLNIIGCSATPHKRMGTNLDYIFLTDNPNYKTGYLDEMNFYQAVEAGKIIKPTIKYISLYTDKITDEIRRKTMYEAAAEAINNSKTGFIIMWANSIKSAEIWYEKFSEYDIYRYYGAYNEEDEFRACIINSEKHILLCVGRCKEGYDMPVLDVGICLDSMRGNKYVYIQKLGRICRIYKEDNFIKTNCWFLQGFECNSYENITLKISKLIYGYMEFTEMGIKKSINILKNGGIQSAAVDIDISNIKEINWQDIRATVQTHFEITYLRLKKIVAQIGIKSIEEYKESQDIRLIKNPELLLGWKGWVEFLGIEDKYYTKENLKKILVIYNNGKKPAFNKIKRIEELIKLDNKIPPYNLWDALYNKISDLLQLI